MSTYTDAYHSQGETVSAQRMQPNYGAVLDGFDAVDQSQDDIPDVAIRMSPTRHPHWNFVDDGGQIELYVIFADGIRGIRWEERPTTSTDNTEAIECAFQVHLANQLVPLKPMFCFVEHHGQMYKAVATVGAPGSHPLREGDAVPFCLEYYDRLDNLCRVKEVTPPNREVFYQPVWKELKERNSSLIEEIMESEGQEEVFQPNRDDDYEIIDRRDAPRTSSLRPTTPVKLMQDDFFLHYTRRVCSPILRSQNPCLKILKELMVTPLTNFTGLSLLYQLYLVEIFHVKFFTKAGHYVCMPLIVLFTATWFAQWRFVGHYKIQDFSILILNGTAVFLVVLQAWYLAWGCLYRMYLFGVFMIWPLVVIYILANVLFQIIVINSLWINHSDLTVRDVVTTWGQNSSHWHDFITLRHFGVVWYFHPLIWALVFCFLQALSHVFEDKLPPRVSQTAHWMDISTILRDRGFIKFSTIALSQTIFGTLNEFFASPRLLPLLILRICYTIGYEEAAWLRFRLLVDECLKFGDPAIDYIGRGGAQLPRHFEDFNQETMEKQLQEIERGLSKEKKEGLKDPNFLEDPTRFTQSLQYYVLLRHRLSKYHIQVNAYGPFTPKGGGNPQLDNSRMENDFPNDDSFRFFLDEVRAHFAEMEWNFVNELKLYRI